MSDMRGRSMRRLPSAEEVAALEGPAVSRYGMLDMQVCVPADWTDEQAREFAEREYPCGTSSGWSMRTKETEGDGYPERTPCEDRPGFVHITFDA